jgi:7,8-dihydroneopterin aldolase/epimerase/oxygenase
MDSSKADANAIFVHDLRVEAKIGVWEWEKRMPQSIRLDLEFGMPSDRAFRSGELSDALDYSQVVARVKAFAADNPHPLLERFAQAIADIVLVEFAAPWVKVRVAKLAPIAGVRELGVAIERHRAR